MTAKLISVIGVALALGLTFASGAMYRSVSGQWVNPQEMTRLSAGIDTIPDSFGPWRLTDTKELGEYAARILYCEGYINNTYVNEDSGKSVNVAVILGPPGPISVHTPEICYSSRDFEPLDSREALELEDAEGEQSDLWALTFRSTNVEASMLHVYYGWSTDGTWKASNNPRFQFAGKPYLLKLQMATQSTERPEDEDEASTEDVGQTFLKEFLPLLRKHVFASPAE